MAVWVVDPDWYFHTAAVLGHASQRIAAAAGTTSAHLAASSHMMAGTEEVGTAWGTKYDAAAVATIQGAGSLSQAWSALAGRVYQAGVNHAWAEFRASNGKLPTPQNLPPRPPISQIQIPPPPTSIGSTGVGLTDVLPTLVAQVGVPVPNGDTARLSAAGTAWAPLGTALQTTVEQVIAQVQRPDPSLPDATAFYDTIMTFNGPGGALATDATALGKLAQDFSAATTVLRNGISDEIGSAAADIGATATVSILATEVTGGSSDVAGTARVVWRIASAGRRIYNLVKLLETATTAMRTFTTAFQPGMKAVLDNASLIPAEGFERNPDGTVKHTVRYFPRAKWEAWQRYLQRGGTWDIDRWSKAYDQLQTNATNGYAFDKWAAEVMGYDADQGWRRQYSDPTIVAGRRWDYANLNLGELVENKSGRLDLDQLSLDQQALDEGWHVTYNINANYDYSPSEIAALQRLQDMYPGLFVVNRL